MKEKGDPRKLGHKIVDIDRLNVRKYNTDGALILGTFC
jgi:hypothetical protein